MLSTALFAVVLALAVATVALAGAGQHWRAVAAVAAACAITIAAWAALSEPYDIRKVLGTLVMPVGLLWLALLLLAAFIARARRPALTAAGWLLWVAFSVAGCSLVGDGLVRWLERDFVRGDVFAAPHLDALLVLGGGIGQHSSGQLTLGDAGDRVVLAARLFHRGAVDTLITTGPKARFTGTALSVPEMTSRVWQDLGVPAPHILPIEGPRSTTEEISALARLVAERRWPQVGVLSSGYHLRRVRRLCARHHLQVTYVAADLSTAPGPLKPVSLLPSGDGFEKLHRACWELVGAAARR